jgi:hypothetical protein
MTGLGLEFGYGIPNMFCFHFVYIFTLLCMPQFLRYRDEILLVDRCWCNLGYVSKIWGGVFWVFTPNFFKMMSSNFVGVSFIVFKIKFWGPWGSPPQKYFSRYWSESWQTSSPQPKNCTVKQFWMNHGVVLQIFSKILILKICRCHLPCPWGSSPSKFISASPR